MTATRVYKGGVRPTGCKSEALGERVRYFRLQRGMSQFELSEGICSMQLISAIERGATNPRVPTLARIADRLKVPLHELYRPEDGDFPNNVKLEIVSAYLKRNELDMAQDMLDLLRSRDDLVEVEKQTFVLFEGELLNKQGRSQEAIEVLLPLINEIEVHHSAEDELLCQLYNQLGTAYYSCRNFSKAYSAYQRGYQTTLRFPVFNLTSAILAYNMGLVCNELEMRQDSQAYLEMARNYFESVSDLPKLAHTYFHSAIASKDESYLQKARSIYETLESFEMLQVVRQHQAFYFDSQKDYRTAANNLVSIASELSRQQQDEKALFTLARAVVLSLDHDDLEYAWKHQQTADLKYEELSGENSGQYIPYYHMAKSRVHHKSKNFEDSLQSAKRASDLYVSMSLNVYAAEALSVMVKVYQEMGMLQAALDVSLKINELLLTKEVI